MTTTTCHDPDSGTPQHVLAPIRDSVDEPEVIEHPQTPPSRQRPVALVAAMDCPVRDLLRRKGTPRENSELDILPNLARRTCSKEDGDLAGDARRRGTATEGAGR